MGRRVVCFLPGDYRPVPNELAKPNVDAFVGALIGALHALGHEPKLIDHFLTTPADAIETLSGIDDPMIGVYVHWVYGPHTTDGVVGQDNPLLLASNFYGTLARPRRPAQHRRVPRQPRRACSAALWSDAADLTTDECVHGRARRVGARPGAIAARRRLHPRTRRPRSSRRVRRRSVGRHAGEAAAR